MIIFNDYIYKRIEIKVASFLLISERLFVILYCGVVANSDILNC